MIPNMPKSRNLNDFVDRKTYSHTQDQVIPEDKKLKTVESEGDVATNKNFES